MAEIGTPSNFFFMFLLYCDVILKCLKLITGNIFRTESCISGFGLVIPCNELINVSSAFKKCGWDITIGIPFFYLKLIILNHNN